MLMVVAWPAVMTAIPRQLSRLPFVLLSAHDLSPTIYYSTTTPKVSWQPGTSYWSLHRC